MKNWVVLVFIMVLGHAAFSQDEVSIKELDSLYKEDQFYAGVTYNLLLNKPNNVSQNGFSLGFHFGFIKDMPINKRRNLALGLGLGYSSNSYNQNILIEETNNAINYTLLQDGNSYSKNRFISHAIEMPFEIRWRTSTPDTYSFWRIYTGVKLGYIFKNAAKFRGDLGDSKFTNIKDFNEWQYGLTFGFGYNTWNIHLYYGLNSILSDKALLNNEAIEMNAFKMGLIFYFL